MSDAPTATQLGLVPGFALQNGDLLAQLIGGGAGGGGGGLGLGNTVNPFVDLSSSAGGTPVPVTATITIVSGATVTGNLLQLSGNIPIASTQRIYNQSGILLAIAPPPGGAIDTAATDATVGLSPDAACDYVYIGSGAFLSDLLGSPSA